MILQKHSACCCILPRSPVLAAALSFRLPFMVQTTDKERNKNRITLTYFCVSTTPTLPQNISFINDLKHNRGMQQGDKQNGSLPQAEIRSPTRYIPPPPFFRKLSAIFSHCRAFSYSFFYCHQKERTSEPILFSQAHAQRESSEV